MINKQSAKLANLVQYSIHDDVAQALCVSLPLRLTWGKKTKSSFIAFYVFCCFYVP